MASITSNRIARAKEVIARCRALASFTEHTDRIQRTFLSAAMRSCHQAITGWMQPLGVPVEIDAVGNLRGFYPGNDPGAPRFLLGSHLDTVPNGGAYDGALGVLLAIALLEELQGQRLPFGVEVIGFSEEEGVRFGVPFIGSRALVSRVDEELLGRRDGGGISVRQAIRQFGLDEARMAEASLGEGVLGYLEFHIEQGPVLENIGRPLGVVEAIVGQTRSEFTFLGSANHAGTTPMDARRDALAAAAEWMVGIETEARGIPGLVATVGSIEAHPGATNVIPGEVGMTLDVRHRSDDVRLRAVEGMTELAKNVAKRRGLSLECSTLLQQQAVAMDRFLTDQVEQAIRNSGCEPYRMSSGAGHDAMILAERVPVAMIFLRSPGGISHNPAEAVLTEDVARAIDCGVRLLPQLASQPQFLGRTCRA